MKKIFIAFLILISVNSFSQTIKYSELSGAKPKGTFETYVSKSGDTYSVGDTVKIGIPSGTNGKFVYISKIDIMGTIYVVGQEATNTNAVIKKIRVAGTKNSGWKVSFQTKGLTGIDNYFFNIEDAIENGEVKSKGMTSDQALSELKKAKDKLDLGLITQAEYDKIKESLIKYIK